ncbi:MAG: hypothetical protein AAF799_40345 [Myxococcota bacterium]
MKRPRGHSASYARACALALGLSTAAACGEPSVDVVVVWVDGVANDAGRVPVRIYDAGERQTLEIDPDIPGANADLLSVGIDNRARGIGLSEDSTNVWVERGSGRTVVTNVADAGAGAVASGFWFARGGDATLRRFELEDEAAPLWFVAPLSGPEGLQVYSLRPPRPATSTLRWAIREAEDAPVVVLAEVGGARPSIQGEVVAVAYPSDFGEGPVVDQLQPLARGFFVGRGIANDSSSYITPPACPERACLSPSGRWLYGMDPDGGCQLLRWTWTTAESEDEQVPVEELDLACPGTDIAVLAAVLGDDVVVWDDPLRLYLVDLAAGRVQSVVKPRGPLRSYLVDRGRGLVVVSEAGEVVHIDVEQARVINAVQLPCTPAHDVVVSPNGNWMVRTCNGQAGAPDGLDGQVQRVSVLGTELYSGIPMIPIAVDDDGNALLFSVSSGDEEAVPRGLFVLSGNGDLTRVDDLEPFPARVSLPGPDGQTLPGRFAVAGPA